jgi:hypothetical protein
VVYITQWSKFLGKIQDENPRLTTLYCPCYYWNWDQRMQNQRKLEKRKLEMTYLDSNHMVKGTKKRKHFPWNYQIWLIKTKQTYQLYIVLNKFAYICWLDYKIFYLSYQLILKIHLCWSLGLQTVKTACIKGCLLAKPSSDLVLSWNYLF